MVGAPVNTPLFVSTEAADIAPNICNNNCNVNRAVLLFAAHAVVMQC
jgi:hypothetical protein